MKSVVIQLSEPLPWFSKTIEKLVVKEPSGALYLDLGEPRFFVRAADGTIFPIEREDVVAKYLGQIVVYENGEHVDGGAVPLLRALPLADTMALKGALLDFFVDAASTTSRENSGL